MAVRVNAETFAAEVLQAEGQKKRNIYGGCCADCFIFAYCLQSA